MRVDRPIIFSAPMIRALLDGRKTMTRRLAFRERTDLPHDWPTEEVATPWQRVQPGDRLWVREAWWQQKGAAHIERLDVIRHDATDAPGPASEYRYRKRSPLHMPRWASRLTLTVTATKIERLQEISEADARAEGVEFAQGLGWTVGGNSYTSAAACFRALWLSLHGTGSWDANPEVVALTFTVEKRNIDSLKVAA